MQGAQDTVKRRQPATNDGSWRRRVTKDRPAFLLVAGHRLLVPLQPLQLLVVTATGHWRRLGQAAHAAATAHSWEVEPFGDAVGSYFTHWDEYSCWFGKSAKSPAVAGDGSIIFLATKELPPEQPVRDERRAWRLTITSQEGRGVEQVGPEVHGLPDLVLVPRGSKTVVAASLTARERSLRSICAAAGLGGSTRQKVSRPHPVFRRMVKE
ncbi:hypothetical protein TPA0908_09860 [Micromonospora sp. AKA38]|nr:hypothetical protein TPA0908_09860 [Micromonospora sp. AKA38]